MEKIIMSETTRAIVDFADEDNASEMRNALYAAIQDKVMAHIDAHKHEVARNLITPQEVETEVPTE
jgi:hypothetical protein